MRTDVYLPKETPNDNMAEVVHWRVADRSHVDAGDEIVDVETSKAIFVIQAPAAGYLLQRASINSTVAVGQAVASIHSTLEGLESCLEERDVDASTASADLDHSGTRFSSAARAYLRHHDVPPSMFQGLGLVTVADIQRLLSGAPPPQTAEQTPLDAVVAIRQRVPTSKQLEIDRLTAGREGNLTSALTILFESAGIRKAAAESGQSHPIMLPIVIHHLARTLERYPNLNSYYSSGFINYYEEINVGVAIDLGHGLRVPVLHKANQLTTVEVRDKMIQYVKAYMERRLTIEDMAAGTATISDLSGDGIWQFQPLLNMRQSVAIGVGGDPTAPGHPMSLTAVYDHRVTTGREVAAFLKAVCSTVGNPVLDC